MSDIASLGIKIDSTQATTAASALDDLAAAATASLEKATYITTPVPVGDLGSITDSVTSSFDLGSIA